VIAPWGPTNPPWTYTIRAQIAAELPARIAGHHERTTSVSHWENLLAELIAAREAKALSLADVTDHAGMDLSAWFNLETGQRSNPTVKTLARYAKAVGKRLVVTLADEVFSHFEYFPHLSALSLLRMAFGAMLS
jgi:hypothetical protein